MQMCAESENHHFSHIFFQHEYRLENLYVYSLDLLGGKGVSNF